MPNNHTKRRIWLKYILYLKVISRWKMSGLAYFHICICIIHMQYWSATHWTFVIYLGWYLRNGACPDQWGWGGGMVMRGGGAIRYHILDPHKNQISDIRPPPPPQIKYQISRVHKNRISGSVKQSDIRYQTPPPKKKINYHISHPGITPPKTIKYQISRYPPHQLMYPMLHTYRLL